MIFAFIFSYICPHIELLHIMLTDNNVDTTMNVISDRIINLSESETHAMAGKNRKLKDYGFDVIYLGLGEPDFSSKIS